MPVRFQVVAGASPDRVVRQADPDLLPSFVAAARALVEAGAVALTTGCGFLARHQSALQAAVPVPVWTSSLLILPTLERPGVVTVDGAAFDTALLQSAGAAPDTPVEGLAPGCSLQRTLLEDGPELDAAAAEAQTVDAATRLCARAPGLSDLVLECTNLPPYADAVRRATGRPVHHLMTLVHERWKTLA